MSVPPRLRSHPTRLSRVPAFASIGGQAPNSFAALPILSALSVKACAQAHNSIKQVFVRKLEDPKDPPILSAGFTEQRLQPMIDSLKNQNQQQAKQIAELEAKLAALTK